ncbi:flagellar hook-length control protein FliK [Parageobacillus toebii]|uniref:flagellar hook-length control protein FliK n=1 Tax=Parageobacillus toebii TaxID=153151 RepID=UPI002E22DDD1|nr:flagellar hook-length control protein FliK [Parageobacillus toebii]
MKIGTSYPLFGQPIVGPPKKSTLKLAGEKEECSPFQQLLAMIETNAKNEEGTVLVSNERFSTSSKEQEDVTGEFRIEESFSFLLFLLNNMIDTGQTNFHSIFPNRSIEQLNNVVDKETIIQLIQQISNVADKDISVEQISNVINDEAASRLYSFFDNDIHPLQQNSIMKENEEQIDIQAFLREMLTRLDKQEEKSKKTERSMLQNRFSLSSAFSKIFDSSLGDKAAAENVERQKESLIQPFNRLLPNGNIMMSKENVPIIAVDQTLSEQKANEAFLQQFTNIIQSGRFTRFKNGNAQFVIRLYPEHLGTLTIKIVREHGTLTAKLIASTDSAKELLDANLSQLQQVLSTENITVEKWNVLTQDRHAPAFYQEERGHEQKERQQRKEEKAKKQPPFHTLMSEMIDRKV